MKKELKDKFERIEPLMAYFKEFGSIANIKQSECYQYMGKTIKIGWLVTNLRQKKRKNLLDQDIIEFLNYMGMDWDPKNNFKEQREIILVWFKKYKTLANLTQYSTIEVADKIIDVGSVLYSLRDAKRENRLTDAQIEFCDMLGIVWAPKDTEVAYRSFVLYKEKFGTIADIDMNTIFVDDNGNKYIIGKQLNHVRDRYRKGLLDENEVNFFESLGIIWSKKRKQKENLEMV